MVLLTTDLYRPYRAVGIMNYEKMSLYPSHIPKIAME